MNKLITESQEGKEHAPFGVMEFTLEKYPKVVFLNEMAKKMLAVDENSDWLNFVKENIYFMLPFNEKMYFSDCLDRAASGSETVQISHGILNSHGEVINITGWIYRHSEMGESRLVMMFVENPSNTPAIAINKHSYFKALESAYNLVFEINLAEETVNCIYGRDTSQIGNLYDITATIDSAQDYWLNNYILPEDKAMAKDLFDRITSQQELEDGGRPLQMEVGLQLDDGTIVQYIAVAVKLNETSVLLCCRDITNVKYNNHTRPNASDEPPVFIRTFGHFDVFVGEQAIRFSNKREKELMAILVDRQGGNVTSDDAIALLWEDEPITDKIKNYYRKIAMGLKNTLESYGVGEILVNRRGVRSIDTTKVKCDYYEMTNGSEKYRSLFHGVYMTDYSWAETTLALLIRLSE